MRQGVVLYHFAPAHMAKNIREEGLTLGKFPLIEDELATLVGGIQWLTADPDPEKQSWATSILVPYSRTAYRLTVEIPGSRMRKLHKATSFTQDMDPAHAKIIADWDGSENWYVYEGIIPPKWIKKYERMQEYGGPKK